ncbi:ECF RNA polymerase sigma factor SigE [Pirellulimonas nuda]|uniref:ECF RNA polymerase sigma factor SigE n=1 Tax=Pirellulimonas nuda TaxID=2528009 RepID=A0A518DAH1_9BACT|nr:sigma-70 family RNA polymerase sigma factor [Pirellulimonas nuda]QDU88480.1 ECF RNA polymerase sigma factor SigE [Pirellulimonas nuda]
MSSSIEGEARIVAAVAGDVDALQSLLIEHHRSLSAHIERLMPANARSAIGPEDVLQQTYLKAFKSIGRFEPRGEAAFYGWLRLIAERQLMDMCRKRNRERLSNLPAHSPGGDASSSIRGLISIAIGDGPSPGQEVMLEELQGAFQVALAGMPEHYRQVLRLRYLEDRPLAEVAEAMGTTEGAVRGMCHRARQQLREELLRLSRFV